MGLHKTSSAQSTSPNPITLTRKIAYLTWGFDCRVKFDWILGPDDEKAFQGLLRTLRTQAYVLAAWEVTGNPPD